MSTAAKQQIIQTLDDLPEQSLAAVAEFVDFLRAKAVAGPVVRAPARVAKLGGLWKGHAFSEEEIDEARGEAWAGSFVNAYVTDTHALIWQALTARHGGTWRASRPMLPRNERAPRAPARA